MAKKTSPAPAETVRLYDKLIAGIPDIERRGASMPYTSCNGNMFTLLSQEGILLLRLPEEERNAFIKKYKTRVSVQYGAVMKEYVDVPPALLTKTSALKKYLELSYAYAKTLKPKPTKRK